jgi:predicted deacylase
MAPSSSKSLGRIVTGFWVLNFILGILIIGALLLSANPAVKAFFVSPTPTLTDTQTPTLTQTTTITFTPTQTGTPTFTAIPSEAFTPTVTPTETRTPIPYSEGPIIIGHSVQNRPLEVYRFGTGPTERLIVAGMHGGNEFNTIQLADLLISYLKEHPEIVPPDVTLFILRDLNPDGEARAHNYNGRANANNVDLNRNWDANWQKDWPRNNCWTYTYVTSGKKPSSEPETQALMAFILSHHFDALINYHSAALGIFAGGLPPDDYSIRLAKAVAAVTTYPYPPINVGCIYTGGFTDWADEIGIAALDIELTDHTHTDYEMNLKVLETLLNWKR